MIPSWLTEVPETVETSCGFSYISAIDNERMTYIPLFDRRGHFDGHISCKAEGIVSFHIIG